MEENKVKFYEITYERRFFNHWYVMRTTVEESFKLSALRALTMSKARNIKAESIYPEMAIDQLTEG